MGTFRLQIDISNAAFPDTDTEGPEEEIARILRDVADRLEQGRDYARLLDVNGNTVGTATLDG